MNLIRRLRQICPALVLLAASPPGNADAPGESLLPEEAFYGDLPVLLTASRLPQDRQDAPVAVTLIDREMIEASGFTEIAELLRLVPGMLVGFDRAHTPVAGYLMLEEFLSRRMQVLVDGRSIYTPTLGGPVWSMLPLNIDDIERIEVIRGPNAASYGSNSFLGVINIITRDPGLDTGWNLRASLGDDSLREYSLRKGGNDGAYSYRFSAWSQENSGFVNRFDGKDVQFFNGRVDYRPNTRDVLTVDIGYADGDYEQDEPLDPTTPEHMRHLRSTYQLFRWQRIIGDSQEIYLQAYHNLDDHIEELNLELPGNILVPYDQNYRAERYDVEFQHTLSPAAGVNMAWGGSLRKDKVITERYILNSPITVRTRRAFLNASWDLGATGLVNGGLMYEDNDIVSDAALSGLLSWNYDLQPDTTLRLMAATATRTPVALEQFPDWTVSVPGLSPPDEQLLYKRVDVQSEKLTATGIGLVGQALEGRLAYDLSYTNYQLQGLIGTEFDPAFPDLGLDPGSDYVANLGDARLRSLELSLQYRFVNRARLVFGFSNARIHTDNSNVENTYGDSVPENLLSLLAIYPVNTRFTISGGYYLIDNGHRLGRAEEIDEIHKFDLRLAYQFRIEGRPAELVFTGQNLGADYDGLSFGNRVDERLFVTLKLRL